MLEKPKYIIDLRIQFEKIREENDDFKEIGEENDNLVIKTRKKNIVNK